MEYKKVLGALTIAAALSTSGVAFAQTSSTTVTGTTGTSGNTTTTSTTGTTGSAATTPTAPNTGAGGDTAQNLALLGGSALVVAAGSAYMARRKVIA
jgi:UDP-N-acetylmuramyl tripeptide synthase